MNTIGSFLHDAREKKKISFKELSFSTKIKESFLKAIESEKWDILPEYPIVLGFVRNIAGVLDIPVDTALALLRRDYPPKTLKISPSPDISKKFSWSPKITFALGIITVCIVLFSYLVLTYANFTRPPKILIEKPKEGEVIINSNVTVQGKTDADVTLSVNNQPILVDENGRFVGEVKISKETNNLLFKAISRSGKENTLNLKITTDF